jgi:hypothetical protein
MSAGGDLGYVGQWKRPAGLLTRADVEVKRFETLASSVRDLYRAFLQELRGVEDRGRPMRNARSAAVDGRIGCHDPPRSSGGLPGRYGHRLLPICCPAAPDPRDHSLNRPAAPSFPREREGSDRSIQSR